jgi:hypothetical protein
MSYKSVWLEKNIKFIYFLVLSGDFDILMLKIKN